MSGKSSAPPKSQYPSVSGRPSRPSAISHGSCPPPRRARATRDARENARARESARRRARNARLGVVRVRADGLDDGLEARLLRHLGDADAVVGEAEHREEFERALEETGLSEDGFREKVNRSWWWRRSFTRPKHRTASVVTNLVYALGA